MGSSLTLSQHNAVVLTSRVATIPSLLGAVFVLLTFLLGREFDKPINRLIFLASWSNLGLSIATLIAEDGGQAGANSSLCQFQAWVFQFFLGVDVYWALCMAFNVYLALFRKWTAPRMQAHEWKYFTGCYGISFILATVYLFLRTEARGRVYGDGLIWCWITDKWDFLRIATFYGISWIALLSAFIIYCLAFRKVWHHRHELKGFFNPLNEDPFAGVITTEIEITRTSPPRLSSTSGSSPGPVQGTGRENLDLYTIDIGIGSQAEMNRPSRPDVFRLGSLTRNAALSETNPDAWLYARVAFLYFCALSIFWIPTIINLIVTYARPNHVDWGLNYTESLLLPAQGFWNAIVYVISSQTACRNLWRNLRGKERLPRRNQWVRGPDPRRPSGGEKGGISRLGSQGKGGRNATGVGGFIRNNFERLSS